MCGNYEKSMYNQLMEVMARLDAVERDLHTEQIEHKNDVDRLNARIDSLERENQLLKDDNARLRSIINIMTVPTLPFRRPPTRKAENLPTPITAASIQIVKQEARKDIRVQPLQKQKWKKKSGQENAGTKSGRLVILPAGNMSQNMS